MSSSFSKLLKSTRIPPAASLTTCSMSLCLTSCLCLPQDFMQPHLVQIASLFPKTIPITHFVSLSFSLCLALSMPFYIQHFSPEPARQIMLHHVRVLAGPSLLDEVGPEGFHGILYRKQGLRISLHCMSLKHYFPPRGEWQSHLFPPPFSLSYLQSSISKTFQRCIIDSLEEPEIVSTMLLPGRQH